ncbi:hypothetical protein BKA67DRAFT_403116 [Truncatella angustata]|uniref:Uncharacterized protein n=1 Tax=Truncatella angustata TaxID=152316 RepID=A0A9P8ZUC0_9PEZI|nr:uncharacterized protein BKA67DRAFT_403116 [Truncatella angustata]KAH6647989.1 hypothetical protein BKA67DRAFT_403116 [Truncatella angustata]
MSWEEPYQTEKASRHLSTNTRSAGISLLWPSQPFSTHDFALKGSSRKLEIISTEALEGSYNDEFFGTIFVTSDSQTTKARRITKLRTVLQDLNHTFIHILITQDRQKFL